MNIDNISIWGAVVVLLLAAMATGLFFLIDRRYMFRMLKVMGIMAVQIAGVGLYVDLLYRIDSWLVDIAWLILMLAVVAFFSIKEARVSGRRFLPAVGGALLAGCVVGGGSLMLCFKTFPPRQLLLPVILTILAVLFTSTTGALRAYLASLRHTKAHRLYLLANGATHVESLIPSARRALRAALMPLLVQMAAPALLAVPMLMGGLLLGGATPTAATVAVLLVASASIAAVVASALMLFWLLNRYLFSKTSDKP